ncbi:MAG: sigma-54-dependent Fis family transcriptional regulator [Acidobacteria bacterium]|nr:MAG: sigma-54-dependent Fis family transcriptional regulator [Acidobacteriota bacterium]TDI13087.1 MAG: sigma-54-dependent Fis family transcriptional regulator [Acidobacteriota bacterium]TDI15681.1 MAG: sigma-54-dependent Fis family transcriptional regulator [Acidobacteriota bacterium]
MSIQPSILVVDDEEIMREVITTLLEEEGYRVTSSATGEEGIERVKEEASDLVLLDLMLPSMSGLETLEELIRIDPDIVVVMISAYASIENAVDATKSGAFDFITKPFKNEELLLVVKNGLKKRSLEIENRQLKRTLKERASFKNIVGKSEPMQQVFDLITQVAPRRSTVLIAGESGTGKELVARAIHSCSPRSNHAFVAVNSGSIPSGLLESELFGHVKGAFTGAIASKKGLFEIADGGTIFLDEVGTLPLETQSRLLRVIQEREFRQVGGLKNIVVDVRIIAATNIDLKEAVKQQRFREDLYYRLNVISINLPPLRERRRDIPLLAEHFVRQFSKENDRPDCHLDPSTLKILMECDWPGNVRELENVMERAVVLAPDKGRITQELLPREILDSSSMGLGSLGSLENGATLKDLVLEYEKTLILTALQKADWSQKRAASLLRMKRSTLNEKLKRLQIKIP